MQVQANVQTVLEGLGLVDNKTAQQDAAALKEVHPCLCYMVTAAHNVSQWSGRTCGMPCIA